VKRAAALGSATADCDAGCTSPVPARGRSGRHRQVHVIAGRDRVAGLRGVVAERRRRVHAVLRVHEFQLGAGIQYPIGPHNYFTLTEAGGLDDLEIEALAPSTADQGQPAHFYPRRNPFLFTVRVPADFGHKEWVWTLTTQGQTKPAYGSLSSDYRIDPQVMSTASPTVFAPTYLLSSRAKEANITA
jgi:hypothetical protein